MINEHLSLEEMHKPQIVSLNYINIQGPVV